MIYKTSKLSISTAGSICFFFLTFRKFYPTVIKSDSRTLIIRTSFTRILVFLSKSTDFLLSFAHWAKPRVSFLGLLHDLFSTSTWNKLGQILRPRPLARASMTGTACLYIHTVKSIASLIRASMLSLVLFFFLTVFEKINCKHY